MTLLSSLALALTAPHAASPIKPTANTIPTGIGRPVNLVVNPGFDGSMRGSLQGWSGSAALSYVIPPPYGDPSVRHSTPMAAKGLRFAGRSGSWGFDMGVQPFQWSMNELDYSLDSSVTPSLTSSVAGSAVVGASAWFRDPNEDDVTITATIYYSVGRPTSIQRETYSLPQTGGWGKFDFKDAIDTHRTVVGLRLSASLDLDVDGYSETLSYDGALLVDDASLTVLG